MRLHSKPSWIALATCLAVAPSALAQTGLASANETDRDIVVITGSATPVEYEKLGQTLTVISGEVIEDQGYSYIADVLRQVPGVAVSQSGSAGSLTQVRTRGSEGNHTLALLDGIDISSPDTGETDFSTLLSGDLARVEVLRGPQSGLYGSNALAGVVNLISRRDVKGHHVGLSAEGGSFNTQQLQANADSATALITPRSASTSCAATATMSPQARRRKAFRQSASAVRLATRKATKSRRCTCVAAAPSTGLSASTASCAT